VVEYHVPKHILSSENGENGTLGSLLDEVLKESRVR
jgi:hypothetical protein